MSRSEWRNEPSEPSTVIRLQTKCLLTVPVSASDERSRVVDPGARAAVPNEADIWASGSGAADVASVLTSRCCDGPSSPYIDGQVATPNRSPQTAGGLGVMMAATRPDNTYKNKQTGRNKDNLMAATRPDNAYKNKQETTKTI